MIWVSKEDSPLVLGEFARTSETGGLSCVREKFWFPGFLIKFQDSV